MNSHPFFMQIQRHEHVGGMRPGMKRWIRAHAIGLTLLLVLSIMAMIFLFSSQPADESDQSSGIIVSLIQKLVFPHFSEFDPAKQAQIEHGISFVVRKTAHFTEYALLGLALKLHVSVWKAHKPCKAPRMLPSLIGILYAVSDEIHQLYVPGRSGELRDVLLDSLGVVLGMLLVSMWRKKRAKGKH